MKSAVVEAILYFIGYIIAALLVSFIGAWIGNALWAGVMVKALGLPALTYWQFYGLLILIQILAPVRTITKSKDD